MVTLRRLQGLDDWGIVRSFLPEGWEGAAVRCKAWTRSRGIKDVATLLRIMLVHLADGCSLQETALRVSAAKWAQVSSVAVFKRLQSCEEWLRWMAERLWRRTPLPAPRWPYRIRAVDATTVQEPGSTGTDWRVHFAIDLSNLQCDFYSLTDVKGGETLRRLPVKAGDLILGDRAYGTPPGVASIASRGGFVLVRSSLTMLPLHDSKGNRMQVLQRLRTLRVGDVGAWAAHVHADEKVIQGRLIGVKRGHQAAQRARRRVQYDATRKGRVLGQDTLESADYIFIWTNVPREQLSAGDAMKMYRLRWQIELAFKRMKSILGLGALPKTADASVRAWIHGKLLVALLIERMIDAADSFSPWGYDIDAIPQSMA